MASASEKEIQSSPSRPETMSSAPDELHKNTPAVHEKEVEADAESQETHWAPGIKNRFPWLGFGCLFFILICVALVLVVGYTSHGKLQENWPAHITWERVNDKWRTRLQLKPSVALAALNTASNLALVIAIGNGVAISWWRRCLHGATVDQLHSSWSFSTSTLELLTAGKKFNLIALAAITTKISLVDNILLQRAATTEASQYGQVNSTLTLPSVSQLPAGYAGHYDTTDFASEFPSFAFSQDLGSYTVSSSQRGFYEDAQYQYNWTGLKTGCYGECYGNMPGFGFNVTCADTITQPRALLTPASALNVTVQSSYFLYSTASENDTIDTILASDVTYQPANQEIAWPSDNGKTFTNRTFPTDTILINTAWAELTDSSGDPNNKIAATCNAVMHYRQCVLQPASVTYPIDLVDTRDRPDWIPEPETKVAHTAPDGLSLSVAPNLFSDAQIFEGQVSGGPTVVAPAYLPWDKKYASNMGVIATQMGIMFQTFVALGYVNGTGYIPSAPGAGLMNGWYTTLTAQIQDAASCVITAKDPMQYIISQMNIIMMRASVSAAFTGGVPGSTSGNPTAIQSFIADKYSPSVVYVTDQGFLWAACVVMLVCVICVLPTYWGFWELGRKVTLGPMEIASAFQAPVLQHGPAGAPGGGEVKALLAVVGDRRVAYGQTEDGKLAVAGADEVNRLPQTGPSLKIAGHTL